MNVSFVGLILALTVAGVFGGPSGQGPTASPAELEQKAAPPIMCSWLAQGRNEFMCVRDTMSAAQKKCDEHVTKQRGEPSKCKCTSDPNYIQDMCK